MKRDNNTSKHFRFSPLPTPLLNYIVSHAHFYTTLPILYVRALASSISLRASSEFILTQQLKTLLTLVHTNPVVVQGLEVAWDIAQAYSFDLQVGGEEESPSSSSHRHRSFSFSEPMPSSSSSSWHAQSLEDASTISTRDYQLDLLRQHHHQCYGPHLPLDLPLFFEEARKRNKDDNDNNVHSCVEELVRKLRVECKVSPSLLAHVTRNMEGAYEQANEDWKCVGLETLFHSLSSSSSLAYSASSLSSSLSSTINMFMSTVSSSSDGAVGGSGSSSSSPFASRRQLVQKTAALSIFHLLTLFQISIEEDDEEEEEEKGEGRGRSRSRSSSSAIREEEEEDLWDTRGKLTPKGKRVLLSGRKKISLRGGVGLKNKGSKTRFDVSSMVKKALRPVDMLVPSVLWELFGDVHGVAAR